MQGVKPMAGMPQGQRYEPQGHGQQHGQDQQGHAQQQDHAPSRSHPSQLGNTKRKHPNKLLYGCYIGLFAGMIWGGLKLVYFGFKFTKVVPGFLVEPFFKHDFLATWPGMWIGWGAFTVFSILAAWIYLPLVNRLNGPWPGIAYGLIWWALLYLVIGPLTEMVPVITRLDLHSVVTELSIFVLWGLFIGYSCGFEYTDEQDQPAGFSTFRAARAEGSGQKG